MEALSELLSQHKNGQGKDDDPEDHWGLDELDELEGEDSDEEDEVEEAEEEEDTREKLLRDADEAQAEPVSQKKDADVDNLADALEKTEI